MICDTCKNKSICKHYEYFKSILINMTIKVDSCELYSNNKAAIQAPQRSQTFRQPLPSREVDDIIEESPIDEEEERVIVNIDDYSKPQNVSIVDMFLKGDENHD